MEDCFKRLIEKNPGLPVEAEIEIIKPKEKCRRTKKYTAQDIRKMV
jgi:hypothetical protein